MGFLWDLIQKHIDSEPYPPSERQVARRLGVAPNNLKAWQNLKRLPSRENLEAIADLVGVRYAVVLDAALRDTGYHESAGVAVLHRRPLITVEAELEAAETALKLWDELELSGPEADRKRGELEARVDSLKAELVSLRAVTVHADSVTEL